MEGKWGGEEQCAQLEQLFEQPNEMRNVVIGPLSKCKRLSREISVFSFLLKLLMLGRSM